MAFRLKMEQHIGEAWIKIKKETKVYHSTILKEINLISLYVSHLTSLKHLKSCKLPETVIFDSVKLEMVSNLNSEINSSKSSLKHLLNKLEEINVNVIKQMNKVFSIYRNLIVSNELSSEEITFSSSTLCSIAEKIDALNIFKLQFSNFHTGKMHFLEYCDVIEDYEKCIDLWKLSDLVTAEQDLDAILST